MPGYNSHRVFNYIIFVLIAALFYSVRCLRTEYLLVTGFGFYIGTELVTPDLDTDSTAYRRWGRLRLIMLPYKWIFRHRQSSHAVFYGAIVRILYICIIILGLYYLLFKSLPPAFKISPSYGIAFLAGLITANALHVVLDRFF